MSLHSTLRGVRFSGLMPCAALGLALLLSSAAWSQQTSYLPTAAPVSGTFQLVEGGNVEVRASFSQQSYTAVAGNVTGTGLQFGGMQNTDAAEAAGLPVWTTLGSVSGVTGAMLSGTTSVSDDNAFSIFTTTRPLAVAGAPTKGRYLMGQLKLSFSVPVQNPVLQIVGLGATSGALGITTELELATQNASLSRLSGNANLIVEDKNILNGSAAPDAASTSGAASGSVMVNGNPGTELIFNVYLKGDGAAGAWEAASQYNGDRWLIGLSKPEQARAALPVYITDFSVTPEASCSARLRWQTSTELGITSITVEHSADGIQFNELTTFSSEGGAEAKSYAFTAHNAVNGANYYRLRVENTTAQDPYSKIIPLRISCFEENVSVQPNPASDFLTVKGINAGDKLSLLDVRGMEVKKLVADGSQAQLNINDLKEGLYMLFVRNAWGELSGSARVQKQ